MHILLLDSSLTLPYDIVPKHSTVSNFYNVYKSKRSENDVTIYTIFLGLGFLSISHPMSGLEFSSMYKDKSR